MAGLTVLLEWANLVAYVGVGVLAVVDAARSRTRASYSLAGVFGLLASIAIVGQIDGSLIPERAMTTFTVVAFAGAGYAVVEHRGSLLPLAPRWRLGAAALLSFTAGWIIVSVFTDGAVSYASALAFVVAWAVCVVGAAGSFWRATRSAEPIQRAQLRLLAAAYVGIAVVLLVSVMVPSPADSAWVQVGTGIATLLLVPGLYFAIEPPAMVRAWWLRRQAQRRGHDLNPVGTWYLDLDAGHVWWSPTTRQIIGIAADTEAALEFFFGEVIDPRDLDRVTEAFTDAVSSSRRTDLDFRVVRPDGEVRWVHGIGEALSGVQQQRTSALFGTLRDITDQKRGEEQLQQALEKERAAASELRRLNELKNAFLSAVSHELRTPLTALRGFSDTLLSRLEELDASAQGLLLERIAHNADRLEALLADLLDLDRLMRGALEPDRVALDITALVRETVAEVVTERHRLRLDLDEPVQAEVDAARIERVVENLVANAIRHTPAGTQVWVRVNSSNDEVHIVVEDDGPGVPDHLKQVVFEPFRQGGESPVRGTGVGLAIVAEFAAMHGGRAWVTDRAGGGASFHVALPGRAAGAPAGSDGPLSRSVR